MELTQQVALLLATLLALAAATVRISSSFRDVSLWLAWTSAVALITGLAALLQNHLWRKDAKMDFIPVVRVWLGKESRDPLEAAHWFVDQTETCRYPLDIRIYLSVTNVLGRSMTINRYQIENVAHSGEWRKVHVIDTRMGKVYQVVGRDISIPDAVPIEYVGGILDERLDGRSIANGETIMGWVFLALPEGGYTSRWRMRIRDMDGSEYVREMEFEEADTNPEQIHLHGWKLLGGHKDLSKLEPRRWILNPQID